jgi:hypothetical protein
MKKFTLIVVLCTIMLSSCLETATNTVIKEDGSGMMLASVDFSSMLKMMTQGKDKGEDFKLDTTIYIRNHSDTSSLLTAEQKRLLREMMLKITMDVRDISNLKFMVTVTSSFNSPEDLTALGELMKKNEYDIVFDRAMKIPMFMSEEKESSKENDNLFTSVFPDFLHCEYKKNSIVCRLDTAQHQRSLKELSKGEFDISSDDVEKMFATATFTNMITLPADAKEVKGTSMKKDKVNTLIQTGSLLDLYKHPENYEYSIKY